MTIELTSAQALEQASFWITVVIGAACFTLILFYELFSRQKK